MHVIDVLTSLLDLAEHSLGLFFAARAAFPIARTAFPIEGSTVASPRPAHVL